MTINNANKTQLQEPILGEAAPFLKIGAAMLRVRPRSKAALEKGWSKAPALTGDAFIETRASCENIGIRLGEPSKTTFGYAGALDFDVKHPDAEPEARAALLKYCPNAMELPSVISGSGGASRHIFFFTPEPLSSWTIAKGDGWELAVKGTGTYVVAPGSIHPDTGQAYCWERPFELAMWELIDPPQVDVALLQRPAPVASAVPAEPVGLDRLQRDLSDIDPADTSYEEWTQIGMALHHESGGDEAGFGLWDAWSRRDAERYRGERDLRSHWRSFGRNRRGRPVTGATILRMASDLRRADLLSDLDSVFPDLPDLPANVDAQPKLMRQKNGELRATLHNAIVKLETVNRKRDFGIRRNDLSLRDEWRGGVIADADLGLIRVAIEQAGMHNVGAELTAHAVRAVAEKQRYHPVRDYLQGLRHDGTPRLDTWLSQYLQVQDSPYVRAVGRAFLIAMVARVMRPGCKHDHVLVLRGTQGLRKSTACSILGGAWAGDNLPSIRDGGKEAAIYLPGHWLIEMAELAPSRKAEQEDLKSFLSRATDETRSPYSKKPDLVPRQCVFIGTSNEDAILKDSTGGRRFWPVTVERQIDTDALARDRDQLFAEALAAFRAGEAWHLTPEIEALAFEAQEAAREEDPWESVIRDWLDGDEFDGERHETVRISELLWKALQVPRERQNMPAQKRVGAILRMMGWTRFKDGRGNSAWKRG